MNQGMNAFVAATLSMLWLTAASSAFASGSAPMQISRNGSQASVEGPARNFTGSVRVDPMFAPTHPSRVSGGLVTFEPGARSAWHTHPLGQTLIIISGTGWVQQDGGERIEIKPGDVIWTPPGVRHWHGATRSNGMSHIAITESLDGKAVDWMESVTDSQYGR